MIVKNIIKHGNNGNKRNKRSFKNLSTEELYDICSFIKYIIETKKLGNIPVGETFKFLDEEYIVTKDSPESCIDCAFEHKSYEQTCKHLCCSHKYRDDK